MGGMDNQVVDRWRMKMGRMEQVGAWMVGGWMPRSGWISGWSGVSV